jgi:hypothetical protein
MPFCSKCGKPVRDDDSFCQTCGNRINPLPSSVSSSGDPTSLRENSQPPPGAPGFSGAETITAVIPDLMKIKTLGLKDGYYLIATPKRSIFIKLTAPIMQKAARYNLDKNPNQTKSVWSRWKAQVAGPNIYLQYFSSIVPEQALRESSENFALDNTQLIKVKLTFTYREDDPSEWQIEFQSAAANYKFVTGSNPEKLLKTAYADKVSK